MTVLRLIVRAAVTLVMGVAVLAAVAAGVLKWNHIRPMPVLSGSMEPGLHVGSAVFVKSVPASSVKVGDVITFASPVNRNAHITHRVTKVMDRGGKRYYETKGDANPTGDPWQLELPGQVGRYAFDVPRLGYVMHAVGAPRLRAVLIVLLTLVGIVAAVRGIWRDEPRLVAGAAR